MLNQPTTANEHCCTCDRLQSVRRNLLLEGAGCGTVNIFLYLSQNEECFI